MGFKGIWSHPEVPVPTLFPELLPWGGCACSGRAEHKGRTDPPGKATTYYTGLASSVPKWSLLLAGRGRVKISRQDPRSRTDSRITKAWWWCTWHKLKQMAQWHLHPFHGARSPHRHPMVFSLSQTLWTQDLFPSYDSTWPRKQLDFHCVIQSHTEPWQRWAPLSLPCNTDCAGAGVSHSCGCTASCSSGTGMASSSLWQNGLNRLEARQELCSTNWS